MHVISYKISFYRERKKISPLFSCGRDLSGIRYHHLTFCYEFNQAFRFDSFDQVLTKVLTRIKRNGRWPAMPGNGVLNKALPCSDESAEEAEQRYLDAPRHEVPDRRDDVPLLLPPRHLRLARQTEDGVNPVMPN